MTCALGRTYARVRLTAARASTLKNDKDRHDEGDLHYGVAPDVERGGCKAARGQQRYIRIERINSRARYNLLTSG